MAREMNPEVARLMAEGKTYAAAVKYVKRQASVKVIPDARVDGPRASVPRPIIPIVSPSEIGELRATVQALVSRIAAVEFRLDAMDQAAPRSPVRPGQASSRSPLSIPGVTRGMPSSFDPDNDKDWEG